MNVVMPKKRAEVVAERSKRLAREMIDKPGPASPPAGGEVEVESGEEPVDLESPIEEGEGTSTSTPESLDSTLIGHDHNHDHDHDLEPQAEIEQVHQQETDHVSIPISTLQTPIPLLEAPAEIIEYERPPPSPLVDEVDEFEFDHQSLGDINEDEDEDESTPAGEIVQTTVASLSPPLPFAPVTVEDHLPPTPPVETTLDLPMSRGELSPSPPILAAMAIEPPKAIPTSIPQSAPSTTQGNRDLFNVAPPPLRSRDMNIKTNPNTRTQPSPGLKKQKSLKQLLSFGLVSPPPPVPAIPAGFINPNHNLPAPVEKKRMTLLSRQSKPNLRVEVKSPKLKDGPSSAPLPTTSEKGKGKAKENEKEKEVERPKMVKRFSLSNMSSAFKKMAGGNSNPSTSSPVPKVPDLPAMYRRKSDQDVEQPSGSGSGSNERDMEKEEEGARPRSDDLSFRAIGSPVVISILDTPPIGSPIVLEPMSPMSPLSPAILPVAPLASFVSPSAGPSDLIVVTTSPTPISPVAIPPSGLQIKPRLARSTSFSSVSSVATSSHHATEPHEQHTLIAISPRTQRDPSASLQDYLTRVQSTEVIITQPRVHVRQHSLEATIVLSSPPPTLPRHRLMEREDSLGSLSSSHRSSGESQNENLKTPLVMPVASMSLDEIRRHIPIAPPRTVTVTVPAESEGMGIGMEPSESFQSLPSLGSGMIVVNSPTSTLASTSTASASVSATGSTSRTSTPKARSLVRMITSPRRRKSKGKDKGKSKYEEMGTNTSTPPMPTSTSVKGFDSIKQSIKLESLHFEALNLDFSTLDWNSELSSSTGRAGI
jgi:hypothetical protein